MVSWLKDESAQNKSILIQQTGAEETESEKYVQIVAISFLGLFTTARGHDRQEVGSANRRRRYGTLVVHETS